MSLPLSEFSPSLDPSLVQSPFNNPSWPTGPERVLSTTNPAIDSPASSHPTQESANLRSCVICRRRKVRCNKASPCSNCTKAGTECVYPPPGRTRRRATRPQDAELLSRLRRLEGVIERLSAQAGDSSYTSNVTSPVPRNDDAAVNNQGDSSDCPHPLGVDQKNNTQEELVGEIGRLAIVEGRSRYVSNRLWASLGEEVGVSSQLGSFYANLSKAEELHDVLDPTSSEDESLSPESTTTSSSNHDGFLFNFYSVSHSLGSYHPTPDKVSIIWDNYLENVAPLVTVLHKPTVQRHLTEAAYHWDTLDKDSEALVLAIYLITIVSMPPDECQSQLGESRGAAVKRYRFAVEQALAKGNLLNTQSLMLLQAAVLFLIGVRREDDTKFVWSMTAVVLRLAQGLGLHRDGTHFQLSPFETEMRRRLWWHICLLDIRSSEDHGTDFQIHHRMYDTRLPLNVNDDDLFPEMPTPPNEHVGCTDMTFSLIRFEITVALRQVNGGCPSRFPLANSHASLGGCGEMIKVMNKRIQEKYIQYCDMTNPLHWVCATVARVILTKLWLIVHHPMTRNDGRLNLTDSSREDLFLTSIEVIEFARLMESHESTAKWGWMSQTNTPWHAVAFVLSELCVRPVCPITDRAWIAASAVYQDMERNSKHRKGMLWRPLSRLIKRAAEFRAEQQRDVQADFDPAPALYPSRSDTNMQGSSAPQYFPQFRIPPFFQDSTPAQPSDVVTTGAGLDFDLSKGPLDILADLFPNTDILAASNVPDAVASQQQDAIANAPVGMPYSSVPMPSQPGVPNAGPTNRDDWDKVMREFQKDVQQQTEEAYQTCTTSISKWIT